MSINIEKKKNIVQGNCSVKTRWYKDAIFYQIYPRSFQDSNNDGIGDIRGIIQRLDYIKELGITAVWLSPVYKTPNDDNGYDISDYRDINPEFGTLEDWKEMIKGLHERGIRLVMDLVVNHTSDEHNWFCESRSSKDNPYRDYYIWRKGSGNDGKKPPNNWTSRFTGSAWKYDSVTDEWYLHLFSEKQPDLNWANPKVRKEVIDICNYWFELGVDGFRCDVITYISKADGLPDGKGRFAVRGDEHFVLEPKIHQYLQEVSAKSWSNYDSMIVGEAIGVNAENAEIIIKEDLNELDTAITFALSEVDMFAGLIPKKLKLPKFKKIQSSWQCLPNDCWPTLYYENHDQPRSISRYGNADGIYKKELAKMLAISLLTLKGTPYIYQGQEIGMTNIRLEENEYMDIMSIRVFRAVRKYFPPLILVAKKIMRKRARDNARSPMQWSAESGAGFSNETPWMKINPNHAFVNVEMQLKNPSSVLNFYKKLIEFRNNDETIKYGEFKEYFPRNSSLYVFTRELKKQRYIVICNFKEKVVNLNAIDISARGAKLVLSNYPNSQETFTDGMTLRPYEAVIYHDYI
ncbi:MAG: alpha-glucosidase [Christensenellaceae bacterium]|jgi:oligo-1,6-glucosidase|nr:alpha-glucosidase [Christensenellaceae bacterium]